MIARLTLDEPESRNALSAGLLARLRETLDAALADDAVRAVVVDHEGPVFSAGADLRAAAHDVQPYIDLLRTLWHSPKPVVCEVRGAVRGGGMGLVCAADVVVASRDATFGTPEVRVGVAPAMVSALLLRRVGRAAALELFLTGEAIGAERAREVGLVNVVAENADEVVASVLKGGPAALATAKKLVNEPGGLDDLERLGALTTSMIAGDEAREGIAAFLEKRAPSWAS